MRVLTYSGGKFSSAIIQFVSIFYQSVPSVWVCLTFSYDQTGVTGFGEKYHRDNGIFLIASYQMAHKSDMPFYGDMNFDFSRIC